ncbi:MAG: chemotaxis protein CheW [Thermomicrobiales bacterium]
MVAQAIAPGFSTAQHEADQTELVTLARMEIGGTRFVLPLADITAVIEPTAMEPHSGDPYGIWIGNVRSLQGAIAIASGAALIRTANRSIAPGRIAILRGEYPVGLAVDRMLSAGAVDRSAILPLPATVPATQNTPVSGVIWGNDDELELVLDRDRLMNDLDADFTRPPGGQGRSNRQAQQRLLDRYGDIDYRRGLEVRFDSSPERWIIPMASIRLVTDSRRPHALPRAPEKVRGLVSWQRQPIPVIDPSFSIDLPDPVALPAKFVVIGQPVGVGQTSVQADAAILVDGIVGIYHNLQIEHGYAWDVTGDAHNILRLTDILS